MSTLNEKLEQIKQARDDIKTSLSSKGVTVGKDIRTYSQAIDNLGTGSGQIKLFETIEEMQSDPDAKEGDKAVVYRKEIQNMTADTEATALTFPETVTLPTAFTDNAYCRLTAVDSSVRYNINCMLDQNTFSFDSYSSSGMLRAEYTSEDGITYTRTRLQNDSGDTDNPVDLGTTVKVYNADEWNDNFGYFLQTGGMYFEGLYEYMQYKVDTECRAGYLGSSLSTDKVYVSPNEPDAYIKLPTDVFGDRYSCMIVVHSTEDIVINGETLKQAVDYDVYTDTTWFIPELKEIVFEKWKSSDENYIVETYHKEELVSTRTIPCRYSSPDYTIPSGGGGNCTVHRLGTYTDNDYIMKYYNSNIEYTNSFVMLVDTGNVMKCGKTLYLYLKTYIQLLYKYLIAPTQLNLSNPNELLPNKMALGKNGVVTGDGTIYDNIGYYTFLQNISGIDVRFLGEKYTYLDLVDYTFDKKPLKLVNGTKQIAKYYQTKYNTRYSNKLLCNKNSIANLSYTNSAWSIELYNIITNTTTVIATGTNNQYDYNEKLIQVTDNLGYIVVVDKTSTNLNIYEFKNDNITLVGTIPLTIVTDNKNPVINYINGKLYIGFTDNSNDDLIVYAYKNNTVTKIGQVSRPDVSNSQDYVMITSGNYAYYINHQSYGTGHKHTIIAINTVDDTLSHYNTTNNYLYSNTKFMKSRSDNIYAVSLPDNSSNTYSIFKITPTSITNIGTCAGSLTITGTFDETTNIVTSEYGIHKKCSLNVVTGEHHYTKAYPSNIIYDLGSSVTTHLSIGNNYSYCDDSTQCVVLCDTFATNISIKNSDNSYSYLACICNILSNVDFEEDILLQNPIFSISNSTAIGYISSSPLSQEEYNTALKTSKKIEGVTE